MELAFDWKSGLSLTLHRGGKGYERIFGGIVDAGDVRSFIAAGIFAGSIIACAGTFSAAHLVAPSDSFHDLADREGDNCFDWNHETEMKIH